MIPDVELASFDAFHGKVWGSNGVRETLVEGRPRAICPPPLVTLRRVLRTTNFQDAMNADKSCEVHFSNGF